MRKIIKTLVICILICFNIVNETKTAENPVKVHFLDVKQGECTLIEGHNENILIDTASKSEGKKIIEYLKNKNIKTLDIIIITHFHEDNYGGLEDVIKEIKVKRVVLPSIYLDGSKREQVTEILNKSNTSYDFINRGWLYNHECISLEVILPWEKSNTNENNNSLVLKGTIDEIKYLFMSDCEKQEEVDLKKVKELRNVHVLKVGNHGLASSTTSKLITQTIPLVAVIISNGEDSPNNKVENRIKSHGSQVFRTDKNGDIIVQRNLGSQKLKIYTAKTFI